MKNHSGAYGFRIIYTLGEEPLNDLIQQEMRSPSVDISWRLASSVRTYDSMDGNHLSMGGERGGSFHVTRCPPAINFHLPVPPTPDAVVHPLSTTPLSVLARWRGDLTLHAGAFGTEDGAWAIAGSRESGKSSMLATLSARGYPIVSDDLLVIRDRFVWSGPACIDLRPDATKRFPQARNIGVIGGRVRHRLSAQGAAPRVPLRGFFFLGWHDEPRVALTSLPLDQRLRKLYALEYIGLMGPSPADQIMEVAALPAWQILRRREWEGRDATVEALLAAVAQAA